MTGINLKLRYSEIGQIKINSNKCKVLTCVFCNVLVCVWGEGGKGIKPATSLHTNYDIFVNEVSSFSDRHTDCTE